MSLPKCPRLLPSWYAVYKSSPDRDGTLGDANRSVKFIKAWNLSDRGRILDHIFAAYLAYANRANEETLHPRDG